MLRIRVRLRTLMIIVAFVALFLVVLMQAAYLKRAEVRMERYQTEAANARAVTVQQIARAERQTVAASPNARDFEGGETRWRAGEAEADGGGDIARMA